MFLSLSIYIFRDPKEKADPRVFPAHLASQVLQDTRVKKAPQDTQEKEVHVVPLGNKALTEKPGKMAFKVALALTEER